ncbi:hypothetical protein CLU81_4696 [Flavobacterium sp. 9]|nr:hypothetical protein CLU81_4696 [Flavobacterium sp. 9]
MRYVINLNILWRCKIVKVLSFRERKNHTRKSTKISNCTFYGTRMTRIRYRENADLRWFCSQFCHFDGGEISTRSSTKIRFSLRSYLRRFLLRRNDKLYENILMEMIDLAPIAPIAPIVPKCREKILLCPPQRTQKIEIKTAKTQ